MEKRKILLLISLGISFALILLAIFTTGVFFERHENKFLPFWGKRNINRNFMPFKKHGVSGVIQTLGENNIVVKDKKDNLETIVIDNQTKFRKGRASISSSDLKVNDRIIVLGEPGQNGEIKARVIQVMSVGTKEGSQSGVTRFPGRTK